MTQITLSLPPEIIDALQHLAGRDDREIQKIICDALRQDFSRRAQVLRRRRDKPLAA